MTVKTENIPVDSRSTASGQIRQRRIEDGTGPPLHGSAESAKRRIALRTYSGQKKPATGGPDDEQIAQFLPLVHKIARRVATYLKPPLSFEDLVSAGVVGLVKAARNFDSSHQAEFKTYAYIRIKGAILDELRGSSLLPANLNKQVRNARQLCQKIAEQTGAAPSDDQLAEKLGITVDEVYQLFEKARAQHFVSIDDFGFPQSGVPAPTAGAGRDIATPDKQLERAELVDKLTEAIQQLNQRRRQIILLYYQQHLTMKQIAQLLKITESRVSQLHASAIFHLSIKLRQWKDGR
ncbi:MAG: sigma-70 family RNA polymerase sigma factor [Phycisphaerae bacterium]